MVYGYVRVSTDHQTTENQRYEILRFCEKQDLRIDCWIEETVSSTKDLSKRKLGRLLRRIGRDDLIIASELSRLGRNLLQVMSILHHCMDVGARIWTFALPIGRPMRPPSALTRAKASFVLCEIRFLSISADNPNAKAKTLLVISAPKR